MRRAKEALPVCGTSLLMTVTGVGIGAFLLLVPAIANGFPLIFPDTGAYLGIAYRPEWTLDRSAFYGVALTPAGWFEDAELGLWIMLALQACMISAIVVMVCRTLLKDATTAWVSVAFLGIAATSLPWHSAQLMPDAFTGVLVLTVWLAASRNPAQPGTPLLWLLAAGLALLHVTHFGVMLAALVAALAGQRLAGMELRVLARRLIAGLLVFAAAMALQAATYGLIFNRWSPSPLGPVFLFARLNEDGLVPRWLDRNCGHGAPEPLCAIRMTLPRDSQVLLWNERMSPLHHRTGMGADPATRWDWVDMLRQAALGSIVEEPLAFALGSARAGAGQFVRFGTLDDECPDVCAHRGAVLLSKVRRDRPELLRTLEATPQLRGELPKGLINAVTRPVAIIGLVLLLPLALLAWRRRDGPALSLILAILGSLLANAFMTGALSDVHDRYQSRVVWLAPFAALLVIFCWCRIRKPLV